MKRAIPHLHLGTCSWKHDDWRGLIYDPDKTYSQFDISTGRSTVIRLMGPDRQEIERESGKKWDRIVAPKDESIAGVVGVVREQVEMGREVYVNVNNHYEGCAVMTIQRLVERLDFGRAKT